MDNQNQTQDTERVTAPNLPRGGKVFDVVKPGKTLAQPSSRPILSNNPTVIRDDQFVPTTAPELSSDVAESVTQSPRTLSDVTVDMDQSGGNSDVINPVAKPNHSVYAGGSATGSHVEVDLLPAETATHSGSVVSHHKKPRKALKIMLSLFVVALLAAVALNFLLDAGLISTDYNIPHTDLI